LVFVLDDFEQNIESAGDGKPVLTAEVVEPLTALFEGIAKSPGGDGEIAVDMAKRLSNRWIDVSRYRAARTRTQRQNHY
jgi:hypothetical protein